VGTAAEYECGQPGNVTNSGATLAVQCVLQADGSVAYEFPDGWNGVDMECRPQVDCSGSPPSAPGSSGLQASAAPAEGYKEWDAAVYTCADAGQVLWDSQSHAALADSQFDIVCGNGGLFPEAADVLWPFCDAATPPTCDVQPTPPENTGITSTSSGPIPAGESAVFRCADYPEMITNLGDEVKV
jgi:hypothetical protein